MKRILPHLAITLGVILAASQGVTASAAPAAGTLTTADKQYIAFVQANPTDYAGQDALSQKLFGSRTYVQLPGMSSEMTGSAAAQRMTTLADLPQDTFSLTITRSAISSGMYVNGSTIFRSDWAGQAAPTDVASLQFSAPGCITLNNHTIYTYNNQNGASSNKGYLYDANVTSKSPIWRINDSTSSFYMSAARVNVSVVLKKSGCSGTQSISAAYKYEANQSGVISTIGASFGALSVGYSSTPLKLQKSSSVLNFTY